MGNIASSLIAATIMEPNNPIVFALKRRAENAEQEDDDYFVDMAGSKHKHDATSKCAAWRRQRST
jgi:hypothetical protein